MGKSDIDVKAFPLEDNTNVVWRYIPFEIGSTGNYQGRTFCKGLLREPQRIITFPQLFIRVPVFIADSCINSVDSSQPNDGDLLDYEAFNKKNKNSNNTNITITLDENSKEIEREIRNQEQRKDSLICLKEGNLKTKKNNAKSHLANLDCGRGVSCKEKEEIQMSDEGNSKMEMAVKGKGNSKMEMAVKGKEKIAINGKDMDQDTMKK